MSHKKQTVKVSSKFAFILLSLLNEEKRREICDQTMAHHMDNPDFHCPPQVDTYPHRDIGMLPRCLDDPRHDHSDGAGLPVIAMAMFFYGFTEDPFLAAKIAQILMDHINKRSVHEELLTDSVWGVGNQLKTSLDTFTVGFMAYCAMAYGKKKLDFGSREAAKCVKDLRE